jgi:hypothetical protein
VFALDALGDGGEPELVRQLDGGADDGAVDLVRLEVRDERPVDLELGDGQSLEVREGRVAGAEVVHRDVTPHAPELAEDALGPCGVLHHRALGDREGQRGDLEPVTPERRSHVIGQRIRRRGRAPRG